MWTSAFIKGQTTSDFVTLEWSRNICIQHLSINASYQLHCNALRPADCSVCAVTAVSFH